LDDAEVRTALTEAGVELLEQEASARFTAFATRQGDDTVLLRGSLEGQVWTACSRCLGPAAVVSKEPDLLLTFVPPEKMADQGEAEVELEDDDLGVSCHDGERIDLSAIVREHLLLALPIAPLCSEACEGIAAAPQAGKEEPVPWKQALERIRAGIGES
jgi:uncharacterized protein